MSLRDDFVHNVHVQNWNNAADILNGMSMADMLNALAALGNEEMNAADQIVVTLRIRGWAPSADRIAWADQVVRRNMISAPPSAVPPDQVADARKFVAGGGAGAASVADDEVTQDFLIEIEGFENPQEQGVDVSDQQTPFVNIIGNQPDYQKKHGKLILIQFKGGYRATDPYPSVLKKFNEKSANVKSFGRVIIFGISAGGKTALKMARELTRRKIGINYVALADPAFDENDPELNAGGITASEKDAYFQTWGYTIDPSKEVHACPVGFRPIDMTDDTVIKKVIGQYKDASLSSLDRTKQTYADMAHDACATHAGTYYIVPRIKQILRP